MMASGHAQVLDMVFAITNGAPRGLRAAGAIRLFIMASNVREDFSKSGGLSLQQGEA